jgi:hypothetical protein
VLVWYPFKDPGWDVRGFGCLFFPHMYTLLGRVYLPMRIKAPAAMATIAKKVPSSEKLILSRGMSPVRMSQMPNKSIPRFLVTFINFIERLL